MTPDADSEKSEAAKNGSQLAFIFNQAIQDPVLLICGLIESYTKVLDIFVHIEENRLCS